MNQIVFVLYSGANQFHAEFDLTLIRLSAHISPYLAKFMKHNKLNTAFLHESVIIFSTVYIPETPNMISSFNVKVRLFVL